MSDLEERLARERALRAWVRQDPIQQMIRNGCPGILFPNAAPARPEDVRVCGRCGQRISGERCVSCEWQVDDLFALLSCHPRALPSCPYCFNKPFSVRTIIVGQRYEPVPPEVRDVPWCLDEGKCTACGKNGFQWQRDHLARIVREHRCERGPER